MLEPGTRIGGRWTVESLITDGGPQQALLRVVDDDGDPWALKMMIDRDEEARARMFREGHLLTHLDHPNIVRIEALFRTANGIGIVLEHVEGTPLEEWMHDHNPPLRSWEPLFRQIVEAVSHIHDHGIVHRDLSLWSILVSGPIETPKATIVDFGFARSPESQLTAASTIMGTPGYMAPEQCMKSRDVDHRADLFSLGCILYYLATGDEAFAAPSEFQILDATLDCRYRPPQEVYPAVEKRFVRTIQALLTPTPDTRIGSCADLIGYLDAP